MRGDGKRENWLLVKENDGEARKNGANEKFLNDLASSVKTGRFMDEIAGLDATERKAAAKSMPMKASKTKKAPQSGNDLKRLMQLYPDVQLATLVDNRRRARTGCMKLSSTATVCSVLFQAARRGCARVTARTGPGVFRLWPRP